MTLSARPRRRRTCDGDGEVASGCPTGADQEELSGLLAHNEARGADRCCCAGASQRLGPYRRRTRSGVGAVRAGPGRDRGARCGGWRRGWSRPWRPRARNAAVPSSCRSTSSDSSSANCAPTASCSTGRCTTWPTTTTGASTRSWRCPATSGDLPRRARRRDREAERWRADGYLRRRARRRRAAVPVPHRRARLARRSPMARACCGRLRRPRPGSAQLPAAGAWTGEVERPDGILTMAEGPWRLARRRRSSGRRREPRRRAWRHAPGVPDGPRTDCQSSARSRAADSHRGTARGRCGTGSAARRRRQSARRHGSQLGHSSRPGPCRPALDHRAAIARDRRASADSGRRAGRTRRGRRPANGGCRSRAAQVGGGSRAAGIAARSARRRPARAAHPREDRPLLPDDRIGRNQRGAGTVRPGRARLNQGRPDGPSRRSGGAPAEITGHEQARTFGSDESNRPDPSPAVRRIPPGRPGVSAREHGGDPVIPDRHGSPVRGQRPGPAGRLTSGRYARRRPRRPGGHGPRRASAARPSSRPPRRRCLRLS